MAEFDRGLYDKYRIERVDGRPLDRTFVLEIDTDPHARVALKAYRDSIHGYNEKPALEADINGILNEYGML